MTSTKPPSNSYTKQDVVDDIVGLIQDPLAQAIAIAQGKCSFCEKSGLAILPVRPAIMRPDSKAPQLEESFYPAVKGHNLSLQGTEAQYTARILRSGYFYVYDEKRNFWENYWVTQQGYFMKISDNKTGDLKSLSPAFTAGREPCNRSGHREIAACITVKDPKEATSIWLVFSDTEWTSTVLKRHQDAAYRQRHMREFNVHDWLAKHSADAAHFRPLDQVASIVAEYATVDTRYFNFSEQEFKSRAATKDSLLHAASSLGPKPGVLLVIDDPVGIVKDIAALMAARRHDFMTQDDREWKFVVSSAIQALQENAADVAKDEYIKDIAPKKASESDLDDVAKKSWGKYRGSYDEEPRKNWHKNYLQFYSAFLKYTLNPLAEKHAAWMRSQQMAECFECSHDDASPESGLDYVEMLTMCLQDTQQYQPCNELYYEWLCGSYAELNESDSSKADPTNLILRALVCNLKTLRIEIPKRTKPIFEWDNIPWPSLISLFKDRVQDKLLGKEGDILTKYLLAIGGGMTKLMEAAVDGPIRHAAVTLGMVAQRPIIRVEFKESSKKMRANVIRQLLLVAKPTRLRDDNNALNKAVKEALKDLEMRGEKMEGYTKAKFMVVIDEETVKSMPKGMKLWEQADWLAKNALRLQQDIDNLNLAAWRERIDMGRVASRVAPALPYVGNLIAGIIQCAAITKMLDDKDTPAMEKLIRNLGTTVLISGTIASIFDWREKYKSSRQATSGGTVMSETIGAAKKFGKYERFANGSGIVGAVIGAACDFYEMGKSFYEGRIALGLAYMASAVVGVISGFLFLMTLLEAIIVLVVALLISLVIKYLTPDKLKEWLQRCVWRNIYNGERPYPSLESEMMALHEATGALHEAFGTNPETLSGRSSANR